MIDIAILDNRPIFTNGLKQIISLTPGNRVVGVAQSYDGLLEMLKKYHIDLLFLDHTNTIISDDDIQELTTKFRDLKIINISKKLPKAIIIKSLKKGIDSYLLDDCNAFEINDAIKETAKGNQFFCGKVIDIITASGNSTETADEDLTLREIEVIRLIASGLTNKQIAERLFLSTHTVNTHRKNIMRKLGLKNTAGIVIYALQENILEN